MNRVSVGQVVMTIGEQSAFADLLNDGTWRLGGNPGLMDHLRLCCMTIDTENQSPSEGRYGLRQLTELSELCGGLISLPELQQPAERVY